MSEDEGTSQGPSRAGVPGSQARKGRNAQARVMEAMRRVSAVSVLHSQAVARHAGLSSTDMECLDLIMTGGPATAGQIGQRTGLSSGAVTGLIDRLERQGLVRRRADPRDRRKVLVEVEPEPVRRLERLFRPMQDAMAALLARHEEGVLDQVSDLLQEAEAVALARVAELNRQPRDG